MCNWIPSFPIFIYLGPVQAVVRPILAILAILYLFGHKVEFRYLRQKDYGDRAAIECFPRPQASYLLGPIVVDACGTGTSAND